MRATKKLTENIPYIGTNVNYVLSNGLTLTGHPDDVVNAINSLGEEKVYFSESKGITPIRLMDTQHIKNALLSELRKAGGPAKGKLTDSEFLDYVYRVKHYGIVSCLETELRNRYKEYSQRENLCP